MRTKILKLKVILFALAVSVAGCNMVDEPIRKCEEKETLKAINDEPAIVLKGNFEYIGIKEAFYFELENKQSDLTPFVFTGEEIPEQYRKDSLSVYISGNVSDRVIGGIYYTETKYLPILLFELKSIKPR